LRHYKADRKCLFTLRLVIILIAAFISGAAVYIIPNEIAVKITVLSVCGIALLFMLVYLPLYIASVDYAAGKDEIMRTSGVFIKYRQSVRYSSVQYVSVISSPFPERTGMNFLILFVYGGSMRLSFLEYRDMQEILALVGEGG